MKVRACILVVCMTVVPAWALCSHHVPVGVRDAVRARLWEPVALLLRPSEATAEPAEKLHPAANPLPAASPTDAPVVVPTERSPADRLAALGAIAVDVRPLEGVAGMHVASCRVAMDAEGQLHRVFQSPGSDPSAATAALADQVQAWRERQGGQAAVPNAARPL